MIRLVVADDQALVRRGFRLMLEIEEDLEVVGEAVDGQDAVAKVAELAPDVVLMDVRMPGTNGIEAARAITSADGNVTKVVMLTTFHLDEYVYDALQAGASGFLLKDVEPELLVRGIRSVHAGEALLAPSVTRRLIETYLRQAKKPPRDAGRRLATLTTRERQTLVLLAHGLSNAEIAEELFVSEATVKTHVGHVLTKLDLRDRVQAVIFAYESGIVTPPAS